MSLAVSLKDGSLNLEESRIYTIQRLSCLMELPLGFLEIALGLFESPLRFDNTLC